MLSPKSASLSSWVLNSPCDCLSIPSAYVKSELQATFLTPCLCVYLIISWKTYYFSHVVLPHRSPASFQAKSSITSLVVIFSNPPCKGRLPSWGVLSPQYSVHVSIMSLACPLALFMCVSLLVEWKLLGDGCHRECWEMFDRWMLGACSHYFLVA